MIKEQDLKLKTNLKKQPIQENLPILSLIHHWSQGIHLIGNHVLGLRSYQDASTWSKNPLLDKDLGFN